MRTRSLENDMTVRSTFPFIKGPCEALPRERNDINWQKIPYGLNRATKADVSFLVLAFII